MAGIVDTGYGNGDWINYVSLGDCKESSDGVFIAAGDFIFCVITP